MKNEEEVLGVTSLIVVLFDDFFCKILTEKKVNSLGKANIGVHCSRDVKRCKKRKACYFLPKCANIRAVDANLYNVNMHSLCNCAMFWAVHLQSMCRQHSLLHVQLTQI